ncbi:MAG: hypothetical protein ACOC9J_05465 [Persicimonas sp.]
MAHKSFDSSDMMRLFPILLAASLALFFVGCQTEVGLDEHRFQCQSDSDCLDGYVCGQTENVCQPVGSAEDAGDVPSDTGADADAGPDELDADPDADASPDISDADDVGLDCSEGTVAADPFGEGEACYASCTEANDCEEGKQCVDSICIESPSEDLDCAEVISCIADCDESDSDCRDACLSNGSPQGEGLARELLECFERNCPEGEPECLAEQCKSEMDSCADCSENQVPVGLECMAPCETNADCDTDQQCTEPYFQLTEGQKVCSYHPENLSGPCSENDECGGPDPEIIDDGGEMCSSNEELSTCLAVGCNPDPSYGPNTGCGLEAVCHEEGNLSFCIALCREQSDCPDNNADETSCRIVQEDDEGRVGVCEPSCSGDDDCILDDGSGDMQEGRCNNQGYCEVPCADSDDCGDKGGTCDTDGFCVFDDAS